MAAEYVGNQVFESYEVKERKFRTTEKTASKTATKTHVVSLSKIEKFIYLSLVSLIALVSIFMLSLKYDAYETTVNIANTQSKIVHQESVNSELNSEAMRQSSYERIYSKAKAYGLSLNNDNVKVVQKDGSN